MKKTVSLIILVCLALLLAGCAAEEAAPAAEPDAELPGTPHAVAGYIVVRGFEWGPGVNKVIVELDTEVDGVTVDESLHIITSHYEREVTDVYLSDSLGNASKTASCYIAFELETNFDCTGSPFEMDMETEHNIWADEYIVDAAFTVVKDYTAFSVTLYADCIENRLCPELERFSEQGSYTGDYVNPITQETETLTLTYAAYEPDSLDSWAQNPLIIWLHGQGEGGTDIEKAILGSEVSALTESEIQSYFTAGEQTGAYVLVVQTPTYWLDAGDGTESRGDVRSRYTEILMDVIEYYLETNPDVDPDRIYIGGASNGGYMTIEMLINYPDYFAAAFPCSMVYAYKTYARDRVGAYRTFFGEYIQTDTMYLTDDKIEALCQTPIWFVAAATDSLVSVFEYTIPVYQALLQAGADNCWCSMYFEVVGTESSDTSYLGHWSWVYLLNNQVAKVQDTDAIINGGTRFLRGFQPDGEGGAAQVTDSDGNVYESLFAWLNDQSLD